MIQSVHTFFPFVDLIGDGYSSFNYNKYLLLTSTNAIAIAGAAADGTTPVPASFSPSLEAYARSPPHHGVAPGELFFKAYSALETPDPTFTTTFSALPDVGPWPLQL